MADSDFRAQDILTAYRATFTSAVGRIVAQDLIRSLCDPDRIIGRELNALDLAYREGMKAMVRIILSNAGIQIKPTFAEIADVRKFT